MDILRTINLVMVPFVVLLIFYCLTHKPIHRRLISRFWLSMVAISILLGFAGDITPHYKQPELLLAVKDTGLYVFVLVVLLAQLNGKEIL